ncbi:copper homeostasis protein CutC [Saccharibacillus sacchari]|uniref:Copper homeostasis protein CutC n=1 Tax=Saccharibacillus sacchari TaxID=456493 RepID=A0ACC6PJM1_9BACL
MLLEVIACTPEDAVAAERGGADRIEWIADPQVGGVTPDLSMAAEMRRAVRLPIRVMVRPRGGGFVYSEEEQEQMRRDIRRIAAVGGLDVVTGVLTPEGTVDESALDGLLNAGRSFAFTFHRAFDEAENLPRALEVLSAYPQVTDILTSGGAPSAPEGAAMLAELLRCSPQAVGAPSSAAQALLPTQPRSAPSTASQDFAPPSTRSDLAAASQAPELLTASPQILAGAGLTAENLRPFLDATNATRIHIGSAARFGGISSAPIDPERVREIRSLLERHLSGR